ncbi:MAG: CdaR family protein [Eubacteriales bacterium]|nr:CdaR family protein [Eubacteriales bacterium]
MNRSNKFTMDIGWKLLSLVIAIGLWFMVINTENPLETRSYTANIQLQNEEALFERGYVVVNEDEITSTRVTVRLRGQRLALDTLSQSSTKVQAVVDLDNVIYSYNGEPVSVPVKIVIPSVVNDSFEILSKSIQTVTVDIQPYINKDFEVKAVVNNTDSDTVQLANAVASPGTVTVYGAKSVVNSIAEVRAEVNPEILEDGMVITTAPVAYDAEGNVVDKVTFSSNELSVKIGMDEMKSVRVAVDITGRAAEGYEVTGIYVSPDTVDVAGKASDLSGVSIIRLPDIDVTGIDSNIIKEFSVEDYLPEGLRVIGADGSDKITVTVSVEEETTKEIVIPAESITVQGTLEEGLSAHIAGRDMTITISGAGSVISTIEADDIKAYVDVDGYEAGVYSDVDVQFELPDGVSLVEGGETVTVTVS